MQYAIALYFLEEARRSIGTVFINNRTQVAQHCGVIRAALEKLGQPVGVNDLHIAGHARSEGLVLVTNNLSEFERVPALELQNWVSSPKV
jgi:predicted nucleic acid-binding protein